MYNKYVKSVGKYDENDNRNHVSLSLKNEKRKKGTQLGVLIMDTCKIFAFPYVLLILISVVFFNIQILLVVQN